MLEGAALFYPSPSRLNFLSAAIVLCVLGAIGCNRYEPPEFTLNFEGADVNEKYSDGTLKYSPEKLQQVVNATVASFGSPDEPFVFEETELDLDKIKMAAGPVSSDIDGTPQGLYRKHCAHCHGISGDGAGPSALLLNPYPRDFRKGTFKFNSTPPGAKPTDDDIRKVILAGVPGTGMPSFGTLPPEEVDALVEYVKYLATRGEVETIVQSLIIDEDEELDHDFLLDEAVYPIADLWLASADDSLVVEPEDPRPTDREASIAAGRELFKSETLGCTKCHGPEGAGDGKEKSFDVWNDQKQYADPEERAKLWALPLQELRPRNLRAGVFRGGSDPVDIYRRIYTGIEGTPMPASGRSLNSTQIWNLVDYVLALPTEGDAKQDAPAAEAPQEPTPASDES